MIVEYGNSFKRINVVDDSPCLLVQAKTARPSHTRLVTIPGQRPLFSRPETGPDAVSSDGDPKVS
jgi:hypothetical protein